MIEVLMVKLSDKEYNKLKVVNMRNLRMVIEFDGSKYKGWQKLKDNDLTIQSKLENVLSKMAEEKIELIGCGKTEIGVHAENYIANFHTNCRYSVNAMLDYLYEFLPEDIVVKDIEEVDERFHARYNKKSLTYTYTINNKRFRSVFDRKYCYHIDEKLDLEAMRNASEFLVGTKDFQSFTTLKPNSKSTVKTINYIDIRENHGIVEIETNANDFLWNMANIIIGYLLQVGIGELKIKDVERVLNNKKRPEKGPIAQGKGLCLKEVRY